MPGNVATHWLAARGYRLMQETEEGEGREGGGRQGRKINYVQVNVNPRARGCNTTCN